MAEKKTIVFEGYSRRLDIFVSDELENFSRSLVQKLIKDGKVTVNGKKVKPSWPLAEGEVVEIELPQAGSKTQLKDLIIHDTKDFFVIIKPAGMLVHPQSPIWEEHPETVFSSEETLVSVILANPPKGFDTSMPRAGLVHRLDRETSGVMVIAKNEEFQAEMVALFSNREVHKT
ncbi:MAG: RluA family pseudouridine synthase, partial [Elusimicrobiaceae bacterium]|nr:RluA family pseudouridine synthase [Elusimicrobiaceae bacterium]